MVTNLASRLQAQATAGEILLSEKMHKRVDQWLRERGLLPVAESLSLRCFDAPVTA